MYQQTYHRNQQVPSSLELILSTWKTLQIITIEINTKIYTKIMRY